MNNKLKKIAVAVAMTVSLGGVAGIGLANAQGPANGPTAGLRGLPPTVCSTTNYTDVAAKALGIQSSALRQALVSGKSLEQIASTSKVAIQTVDDALKTAQEADLAQALKDGLITQQEYDLVKGRLAQMSSNAPAAAPTSAATPAATPQAGQNGRPVRGPRLFGLGGNFLRVPALNIVNSFDVASKAIGISCADMVKAMEGGQSVAQVATSKNVVVQTVIDALAAAEKAAITQDVTEGLLAQAQADSRIAQVVNRAGAFVYDAGQRGFGGFGPGGRGGSFPGDPGGDFPGGGPRGFGGNGLPPMPGSSNGQPPAPNSDNVQPSVPGSGNDQAPAPNTGNNS